MSNVIIGGLMLVLGAILCGVVSVIYKNAVTGLAKLGAKLCGNRTGKVATGLAMVVALLATLTVFVALYMGPLLLMVNGTETMGLVNWGLFFKAFYNNLCGVIWFYIIMSSIKTDGGEMDAIRSAFRAAQPATEQEKKDIASAVEIDESNKPE